MIVDPGLYSLQKSDVFWVTEKRSVPTAFKLFTGEASLMNVGYDSEIIVTLRFLDLI